MPRISYVKIENFRKLKHFEYQFNKDSNIICIVGRGDSGKSTLLEAISLVLSPSWNIAFNDSDFTDIDVNNPIRIETIVYDLPDKLYTIVGTGLCTTFLNKQTLNEEEPTDSSIEAVRIILTVASDLEPKWMMANTMTEQPMRASDRAKLNVFLVSDFVDKHFSWNKGTPLASLLKKEMMDTPVKDDTSTVLDIFREAKGKFDEANLEKFSGVEDKFVKTASKYGFSIEDIKTSIDWKDLYYSEGRLCLHDGKIPFRLKGKGSKRLLSIALQLSLLEGSGIILIDEVEQGLEPDRVQQFVTTLKKESGAQIFLTTHSSSVAVELSVRDIFKMNGMTLYNFPKNGISQSLARTNPEAFFAKRLIIAEGSTEVGILRAVNDFLQKEGFNLSTKGIRIVNGGGASKMITYCKVFLDAGYDVCFLCDNDRQEDNVIIAELREKSVTIIQTEDNLCAEKQLFKDLSWNAVNQLFEYGKIHASNEAIKRLKMTGFLNDNNELIDDSTGVREMLGVLSSGKGIDKGEKLSSKNDEPKSWFKTITHGEEIGLIVLSDFENIKGAHLGSMIYQLIDWIKADA